MSKSKDRSEIVASRDSIPEAESIFNVTNPFAPGKQAESGANVDSGVDGSQVTAEVDIREELNARFPSLFQPLFTFLTGKAPAEAVAPRWMRRRLWRVLAAPYHTVAKQLSEAIAACGAVILCALVASGAPFIWLFALPFCWLLYVNGARGSQVESIHQAIHGALTGNAKIDWILSELASALAFCNPPYRYRVDHLNHHDLDMFASMEDPDVQFMFGILGIEPGQPKVKLWRRLKWALASPRVHWMFWRARFKAVFSSVEPAIHELKGDDGARYSMKGKLAIDFIKLVASTRRVLAATIHVGLPALATLIALYFGQWWPLVGVLLGLTLPNTILYQVSAISHFVAEHHWRWRKLSEEGQPSEVMEKLTPARYFAEPLPKKGSLPAWALWWTKMLFLHLPSRLFVSTSSLPWHWAHHYQPTDRDWVFGPYWAVTIKRDLVDSLGAGYSEHWGTHSQLDAALQSFSDLRPFTAEERTAAISTCSSPAVYDDVFQGM